MIVHKSHLLQKFEEFAAQDQPFHPDYPIVRFKPD